MEIDKIGVHTSHCCKMHYCKYGKDDCPVMLGTHQQLGSCEMCPPWTLKWPTKEGMYWYYGHRGFDIKDGCSLWTAQLTKIAGFKDIKPSCFINGERIFHPAQGWFLPMRLPDLPPMPLPEPL